MKVCSKCKVERNDDEYYSYWHSTQRKYRTRLVCHHCTREQSRRYKSKVKVAPVDEEPKKYCPSCKKDVALSGYYDSGKEINGRYCKSCIRKNQNDKNYKRIMENGGSERVPATPNVYADEYQKAQTFLVLEMLGWKYNDNGVWSKDGVKTADNVWLNIIPQPKIRTRIRGAVVKKKHGVYKYIPQIIQQKEAGMTYNELADIYCCSHTTLRGIVNQYYREKRNS